MSVTPVTRKGGNKRAYKVRYRDHAGKAHSETYLVRADAEHRDAEIKKAKQRREPLPKRGRGDGSESFETFTRESWWPTHVEGKRLVAKTQERYATFLDKHLIPRIGDDPIAFIDVERVLEVKADLAASDVPDYTSARTLKLMRQILGFAVVTGKLAFNPADVLRGQGMLPPQGRKTDVRPLWPDEIEALRAAVLATQSPNALRSAALVSVLGYAGPRPHEALRMTWEDFGGDWLRFKATKGGGIKVRIVPELIKPLVADLEAWAKVAPDKSSKALVFPGDDGKEWTPTAYGNWRNRIFKPNAPAGSRIYDLRHGYASLLVREGLDWAEIARRLGHSVAMTMQHYTHVFEQHRGKPREPMEAVVLKARETLA